MSSLEIIAEIGAAHNGSFDRALRLLNAANWAGADWVKIQTFDPKEMAPNAEYQLTEGPWKGWNLRSLYERAKTPREWHKEIFTLAGAEWPFVFSTVFDYDSVKFLESLGCPRYKIASFELVDLDLIRCAASTGKPLILSTGMASYWEIEAALEAAQTAESITLLKCTSDYPAEPKDANLLTMVDMGVEFGCPVGLSDHTLGIGVSVAAVALGACMIEKHITLDRNDGGLDSHFALEPQDFKTLVTECRRAHEAIGTVHYGPVQSESASVRLRAERNGTQNGKSTGSI
jgi:N-acetylneuraminate synthase